MAQEEDGGEGCRWWKFEVTLALPILEWNENASDPAFSKLLYTQYVL